MTTPRPLALVTGASVGIGRSFALALADRGHDLVVVARDRARLDDLAGELQAAYGASCEVLPADLTTDDGVRAVEARLADEASPVDVLVNNAGFGTAGKFHELPIDNELRMIELNVLALVRLTHAAAQAMVGRGRGRILNVSSLAAFQPCPNDATYGATKAFVSSFSQAVHEELRGTGVTVTILAPGFTRTEFQQRAGVDEGAVPGFLWQQPEAVVQTALRAMERGRALAVPGPINQVTAAFASVTPGFITRRLAGSIVEAGRSGADG